MTNDLSIVPRRRVAGPAWITATTGAALLATTVATATSPTAASPPAPAAALATAAITQASTGNDADDETLDVADALDTGVQLLLGMQESFEEDVAPCEWPYEGVYRVRGRIPIGYRVGGTSIAGLALLAAPGYDEDDARKTALARSIDFVCAATERPLMAYPYTPSYDVRGWGYTYALAFLLQLEVDDRIPAAQADAVEAAIAFYLEAIHETDIESGGWNYARGRGARDRHAPFMTGPTLQALFLAKSIGYEVDDDLIERALDALERSRTDAGGVVYAGDASARSRDAVPGAVGRMLATESTLLLAGRGSADRVRGAIDAFIVHWEWLEKRRRQNGTHIPPYGIAPYYFIYAHHAAAHAIELLPVRERAEYRRRLHGLLQQVREPNGAWNDRVFERSANYGTAMIMLALAMPDMAPPARWAAAAPADDAPAAVADAPRAARGD